MGINNTIYRLLQAEIQELRSKIITIFYDIGEQLKIISAVDKTVHISQVTTGRLVTTKMGGKNIRPSQRHRNNPNR